MSETITEITASRQLWQTRFARLAGSVTDLIEATNDPALAEKLRAALDDVDQPGDVGRALAQATAETAP